MKRESGEREDRPVRLGGQNKVRENRGRNIPEEEGHGASRSGWQWSPWRRVRQTVIDVGVECVVLEAEMGLSCRALVHGLWRWRRSSSRRPWHQTVKG